MAVIANIYGPLLTGTSHNGEMENKNKFLSFSKPDVVVVGVVDLAVPAAVALQELVGRDEGAVQVVPAVKQ